jgi:hypothetical protein
MLPASRWAFVGPLLAALAVLSVATSGALGISDTLKTSHVLPVAQIVMNIACTDISDGKSPYPGQSLLSSGHCLVGGYYIGEGSTWVYIVKRANTCPHRRAPARLVELRRSEISEIVILAKLECPGKPQDCSC